MDPLVGSALISGAASAVNTAANQLSVGKVNYKSRNHQRDMLRSQNQMALENWNLQNEYNSPTAQVERMKAAGLNPNLLYGAGGSSQTAGNSGHAASAGPAGSVPSHVAMSQLDAATALRVGMEAKVLDSQRRNIDAQTARIEAETVESGTRSDMNIQALDQNGQSFAARLEQIELQNEGQREQNENLRIERDKMNAEIAGIFQGLEESKSRELLNNQHLLESMARVVRLAAQTRIDQGHLSVAQKNADTNARHASVAESYEYRDHDRYVSFEKPRGELGVAADALEVEMKAFFNDKKEGQLYWDRVSNAIGLGEKVYDAYRSTKSGAGSTTVTHTEPTYGGGKVTTSTTRSGKH